MLGFIILNYKTWELTIKCVENIDKVYKKTHMIYIVDNASPNESYEKLSDQYVNDSHVKVIQSGENGGYAKGNNVGVRECKKDGIRRAIICNNDIFFKENAVEFMLEAMDLDNEIVIVSPKFFGPDGNINARPFNGYQSVLQFLDLKSCKELEIDVEQVKEPIQVISVPGGCLLIDVEMFIAMGAFDEGTFLFCEEGTVSRQAYNSGHKIFFAPDAEVIHYHSATIGKESLFTDKCLMQSALYYWFSYEKKSMVTIYLMYFFFKIKIVAKYMLGKYTDKGLKTALKECRAAFKSLVSNK